MKNNKGFLLAESLVVSTFVLTVLIFLFVQYQNLMTTYKNNTDYNNPEAIYNLGSASEYFSADNTRLVSLSNNLGSNAYIKVYDKHSGCNPSLGLGTFCDSLFAATGAKKVIYTSSDLTNIKNYIKKNSDSYLNQSLRDFIKRIDAEAIERKGRLIAQFENGYYATIAINTKINDSIPADICLIGNMQVKTAVEGTGLYKTTNGCVYKGTNPNNYIRFNNELWRIISTANDNSLEIIRDTSIGEMPWDSNRTNYWTSPATINTYLNNTYYNSISSNFRSKILDTDFQIGYQYHESSGTSTNKVGLINGAEYASASADTNCKVNNYLNNTSCANQNWMFVNGYTLTRTTANKVSNTTEAVIVLRITNGIVTSVNPSEPFNTDVGSADHIYPVVRIAQPSLTGSGTSDDPFVIE